MLGNFMLGNLQIHAFPGSKDRLFTTMQCRMINTFMKLLVFRLLLTAVQICGIVHVHCRVKITDCMIPCSFLICAYFHLVDVIVNYTTVSFMADQVTNATLNCVYSTDLIQIYHEFGGEVIDILEPGLDDEIR